MGQLFDVQPARGNVGGHQHAYLAGLEALQGTGTRRLALVAVNGGGLQAILFQLLAQTVGPVLGAGKHQHLLPVATANHVAEQFALACLVHRMHPLLDAFGRGVFRGHFHGNRVVHQAGGQLTDFPGKGGGKQQVLPFFSRWQQADHPADIVNEAHVEHAVGFIQHQRADPGKVQRALLGQIQQTAGCGHHHFHALPQATNLRADLDASENHQ